MRTEPSLQISAPHLTIALVSLSFIILSAGAVSPWDPPVDGDPIGIDDWLSVECLILQDYDSDRYLPARALLKLPAVPGLTCLARGHAEATGQDEAPWSLETLEFDILSRDCRRVFLCDESFVRVSLRRGNQTVAEGLPLEWDSKISEFRPELEALHGRNSVFRIGSVEYLYMAFMVRPIYLLAV